MSETKYDPDKFAGIVEGDLKIYNVITLRTTPDPSAGRTGGAVKIELTGRQIAILAACLGRCRGWDVPSELQRFVSIASETVRDGFTEDEMEAVGEALAGQWAAREEK